MPNSTKLKLVLIVGLFIILAACRPDNAERLAVPVIDIAPEVSTQTSTAQPDTSTPTATATPTPRPPTATPRPPTATATAVTPSATTTPAATATPRPPVATATPAATATPRPPTATAPPPTEAPPPTDAPLPTEAPAPTAVPDRNYIGPGAWMCPDSTAGAAYIGSSTQKFHKPTCSSVKQIADHNRVCFESREAAVNAGFEPCGRCNP